MINTPEMKRSSFRSYITLATSMGSRVCVRTTFSDQLVQIRLGNEFFALYQGTTSVVPPSAKMVRALSPCHRKIRAEFPRERGTGAKPTLFCALYGTTKVVP
jgi:hypothetical protein